MIGFKQIEFFDHTGILTTDRDFARDGLSACTTRPTNNKLNTTLLPPRDPEFNSRPLIETKEVSRFFLEFLISS